MVDKTLEAFGLTREEMEQANQQAADQMLPMPYDIPGEVGPTKTTESKLNLSQFIPPNLRQSLSEAGALGYQLADNVIGIDDDYDTSGELLARAIREDPINTIKGVATGVVDSVKAAYDDPRGTLLDIGNEFASAYEMLSTPMEPNASRDEVGQRLEAATLLSAVVPGAQLAAGGARVATSAGARATPSILNAMPEYDPNTVSSFGVRSRSENNPLASKETFSGSLDSLHGYGSWFVDVENPQKTSFVPKDSYTGERYDSSGGTFGSRGVYLERIDDREFSDPTDPILTYPNYMLVEVPFKNAFVVNPTTVGKLREYLDSIGYGGGNFSNPELGDVLTKRLESEGYDGIIVTGFQRPNDFTGNSGYEEYNKYVQDLGVPEEFMQSQVFKFDPEEVDVKNQLSYNDVFEVVPDVEAEVNVFNRTDLDSNLLSADTSVSQSNLDAWSEGAYFKNSETEKPEVMYHGMSGNLRGQPVEFSGENLEPSYMGTLGPGTYLTRDPSVASDFATSKRAGYTDEKFGGQVIPVYTNVTKVVDDDVINSNKELRTEIADLIEENTDDNYLFNLADKLRSEDDINLSSLFTKTEDGKVRSTGVGSLVSSLLESKGYEGISVVTDKGFHEAVIFPGHGGVEFPRQNIKSSLQGPEGQYSRETNDMRFNEGGLAMERQMNTMMAEGGIKDDGMDRDPISGNEIPAGSLAKEVRDDVDAKLSEGEYVVPADVVRYFGVNYFEKLRAKAKAGLEEMDRDGRIGGDPVDEQMGSMMDDGLPFSDEELMSIDDEAPIGMAVGGDVAAGARSAFNPMAFQPGFSFGMGGGSGQGLPSETKTFVNAQGEVRSILFINGQPIQQIPSGFVEDTPENRAKFTEGQTTVTPTSESSRDRDRDRGVQVPQGSSGERSDSLMSEEDVALLSEDPLAFGKAALEGNRFLNSKTLGTIGSLINPALGVLGGSAGTYMEMQNIADARAAKKLMEDRKLTDTEEYRTFASDLKAREDKMSMAAKGADAFLDFSGDRLFEQAKGLSVAPTTPQAIPTSPAPAGSTRSTRNDGVTYDTTRSTGSDGRVTETSRIAPGTSAAPTTSIRPVARPERTTTSTPREETVEEKLIRGGGFNKGGLVQKPKKKPVAKK